jgi:hypothetical protein
MAKKKAAAKKKVAKVDFDDEESVLIAMAKELDCEVDDLQIATDRNYSGFISDHVYELTFGRGGHKTFYVVRDSDVEEELAKAIVKQDLESEPEIFNRDFIESHINIDRLRRELMSDVEEGLNENMNDEASRNPIEFMKDNDIDIPEPSDAKLRKHAEDMSDESDSAEEIYKRLKDMDAEDQWSEIGEEPEVPDREIENVIEETAKAQLRDPMDYLRDIYGDEAAKRAIEIAGIDIDAAVDEAVSTDGAGHFLSTYDGSTNEGPDGIVWWRRD